MPPQATRTAWRAGAVHLAESDPVMARLLQHHGPPQPAPGAAPAARFEALASSIAYPKQRSASSRFFALKWRSEK